LRVLATPGDVLIYHMTNDEWIKQRKDLAGRGQQEHGGKQFLVGLATLVEKIHLTDGPHSGQRQPASM